MEKLVTSEFKLGIIAGGQLGKMLSLTASNWDVKTFILDKDQNCPASTCCTKLVQGDPLNYDDVYSFGKLVDMLTFEVENVNIAAVKKLQSEGIPVNPSPEVLEIIQDKGKQKQFFDEHVIPSPPFTIYQSKEEILDALNDRKIELPFVQKLRRGGYDGKGVAVIKNVNEINNLLNGESVVEKMIGIDREISVIAARNKKGEIRTFPIVEMEFNSEANLVERLICPTSISQSIIDDAEKISHKVISSFSLVGILAIEMFVDKKGKVWVNEVAPRPHNSGHHTIESMITSQFEQLLRAIFDFPLGSTKQKLPAIMINLLGEPGFEGKVKYEGLTECLAIEGVKIHLYGKNKTVPYRKMGHVTILSNSIEEAKIKADFVKQKLKVKS